MNFGEHDAKGETPAELIEEQRLQDAQLSSIYTSSTVSRANHR